MEHDAWGQEAGTRHVSLLVPVQNRSQLCRVKPEGLPSQAANKHLMQAHEYQQCE